MSSNGTMILFGVLQLLNIAMIVAMIGGSIYAFILFVKLARRGIKALDIYIQNNPKENNNTKLLNETDSQEMEDIQDM